MKVEVGMSSEETFGQSTFSTLVNMCEELGAEILAISIPKNNPDVSVFNRVFKLMDFTRVGREERTKLVLDPHSCVVYTLQLDA